jgi:hypothetical protein
MEPEKDVTFNSRNLIKVVLATVVVIVGLGIFLYSQVYKKVDSKTVLVTFQLRAHAGSMTTTCETSGGYSDINHSTQVILKAKNGKEVNRSNLGTGSFSIVGKGLASTHTCTWLVPLKVSKGEEYYVFSVGSRGESSYTWGELDNIQLSLGS